MQSDLARIFSYLIPTTSICQILAHPTISTLAVILVDMAIMTIIWGFDPQIAKWETQHQND